MLHSDVAPKNTANRLTVRPYRCGDAASLVHVFFDSVHGLGGVRYASEQLRAWAPSVPDASAWEERMSTNYTFVAERGSAAVGFIELAPDGHIAMLYRLPGDAGIDAADILYRVAEERALELGLPALYTEASLMAEPFFTRRGYRSKSREEVARHGMLLTRTRMAKELHYGEM